MLSIFAIIIAIQMFVSPQGLNSEVGLPGSTGGLGDNGDNGVNGAPGSNGITAIHWAYDTSLSPFSECIPHGDLRKIQIVFNIIM